MGGLPGGAFFAGKWRFQKDFFPTRERHLAVGIASERPDLGGHFWQRRVCGQPQWGSIAPLHGAHWAGQWQHTIHRRQCPAGLAGHYTFRLQTSEHDSFENVPEAIWTFSIGRPYWLRWWFLLPCLGAGSWLLFILVRSREARLRHGAQLKRETLEA